MLLDVNIYFALHHFLILFGSFDRNKKRHTGEYVLAGLMYYVKCFQVLDFLESFNEHDEWKPFNDVFKCWRC